MGYRFKGINAGICGLIYLRILSRFWSYKGAIVYHHQESAGYGSSP